MPPRPPRLTWRSLGLAIGCLAAITAGKLILWKLAGDSPPFLLYGGAIVVAAWYGGWVLGLLVTATAALLGIYFFVPPFMTLAALKTDAAIRLVAFVAEGIVVTLITDHARRAQQRAIEAALGAQLALAKLEGRDEELRVSREWFSTALRSIGDAVIATDAAGVVTFLNPPAELLTGWSSAEAQGRPLPEVFRIVDEQTRAVLESPVDRVLREGRVVGLANHTVLIARDGRELAIDDSAAPIRTASDPLVGTVLVFRDVTAKRNEERQRAFLADATRLLGSSLDYGQTLAKVARLAVPAIADWAAVDIIENGERKRVAAEHVDPAKVDLLLEMDRRYPADPKHPDARGAVLASGQPLLLTEVTPAQLDQAARDPEHRRMIERLDLHSIVLVPLTAQGRTIGVISLATAESRRRYGPQDLSLAQALADRVSLAVANAQLYAEAGKARDDAQQANRSKDEFLAMLGHELRNPLAPILTALQLMKLRQASAFERERSIIERQVRHVVTLVDDLLDISRITRGKIELAAQPIDLADTVDKALELAGPLIEERQHQVTISVPHGMFVRGDGIRLAQVVTNLLTNAAKYTDRGGRITITVEAIGDQVVLAVRDNGVGIEADLLPNVFDMFVQGRQAIDRAKGGLGLGLAIVATVVKLHGGTVSARSAGPNQGSEFRVSLPMLPDGPASADATAPVPTPMAKTPSTAPRSSGARILVVDDNPDALALLTEALRDKGHETEGVGDAASALALAEKLRPELALLDIGLPLIDGYELARRLRAIPALAAIKLVAVTGYGQPTDKARAQAAGFDEHLVKPISLENVERVVDQMLAAARKRRSPRTDG
jgi:PAS domain S-box-containing protein